MFWARLAGAAYKEAAACWLPIQDDEHPARILPLLVTSQRLHGQEKDCAVYIDCKLQLLDCGSYDL
jgi:hypothetical protein